MELARGVPIEPLSLRSTARHPRHTQSKLRPHFDSATARWDTLRHSAPRAVFPWRAQLRGVDLVILGNTVQRAASTPLGKTAGLERARSSQLHAVNAR
jgi:hypothetical protein